MTVKIKSESDLHSKTDNVRQFQSIYIGNELKL